MNKTIKCGELTWVNLVSPSAKEISDLAKEYFLEPLVAEELTSLTMRSKIDVYENNLYFVLHFPDTNQGPGCEIDFVIGKNFLITTQYCYLPALEKFIKNAASKEEFRKECFGNKPAALVLNILKELYDSALHQIDEMHIKTNKIEQQIFNGDEKQNLKKISLLRRDILDFQRAFYLHGGILSSFEKIFQENKHELNIVVGQYMEIKNLIENSKEIIGTLHETNESLLSTKTNEIMKVLTIMAFITFPLMLLSSIFGMNTVYTPIFGMRGDFWIIIGIMFVATFGMFLFFKNKKWL